MTDTNTPKRLYRYVDFCGAVLTESYFVVKRTPAGVWIELGGYPVKKKFVLLSGRKRYAYPTEAEAMNSYLIRKGHHVRHLQRKLLEVEHCIHNAKAGQIGFSFQLRETQFTFDT